MHKKRRAIILHSPIISSSKIITRAIDTKTQNDKMSNIIYNFVTFKELGKHGRLGNQLFQIAATIGYSRKYGVPIKFPKWFCNYDKIYYSDYFKNKLDETLVISQIKHTFKEPSFLYREIPLLTNPLNLHGYYQTDEYFKHCIDDILYYFEPTESLTKKITDKYSNELSGNTCSIHIRRGDYLSIKSHNVCDIVYYNKCIENMQAIGIDKFLVFSDDINWCKSNFKDGNFHFIEGNNPIEDLFTMSFCKHNIIANSSFSWWGSWLNKNPNKIVYAPSKWFHETSSIKEYESIYRKDMIKILN